MRWKTFISKWNHLWEALTKQTKVATKEVSSVMWVYVMYKEIVQGIS